MLQKRPIVYILIIIIVPLIVSGIYFYDRNNSSANAEISLVSYHPTIKVAFVDKPSIVQFFTESSVIDTTNIEGVKVEIVDSIAQPMLEQLDKERNLVISSNYLLEGKVAVIQISLGEFVLKAKEEEQEKWISHQIVKTAEIIARRNTKNASLEIGYDNNLVEVSE